MSDSGEDTEDTEPELDRRLLVHVLHSPRKTLVLAIATGLAVALELVRRGELGALQTLAVDGALCRAAAERILRHWAAADRAGGIEVADFERLCDAITASARSS